MDWTLLVVCALLGMSRADQELTCNATHEVLACGYGCPPQLTCQNRNSPPYPCANPGFPCSDMCICENGYARNKGDGVCITLEQCDKCPGDNEYFECDCGYDENCAGHCSCFSGYTRDVDDKCVYVDPTAPTTTEEPVVTTESTQDVYCNASLHEVRDCLFGCPPQRTCQNFRGPEPPCVPPSGPCEQQCVCADGYARNQYNGTCVTFAQCDKCPGTSQYFACDGDYSENCTGSCHCAAGFKRDSNNTCVSTYVPSNVTYAPPSPPSPPLPSTNPVMTARPPHLTCRPTQATTEAPVVTTESNQEVYCNASLHEVRRCVYPCPPQRTCQNFRGPIPPCVPPREPCAQQCVCADGYARNRYKGTCVTFEQCDKCPGNSQYFACDGEYDENCVGSCHCAAGYERDGNNTCVSTYVPSDVTYKPPTLPSPPVVTAQPPKPDEPCGNPPEVAVFYNL